jgi:hypothetical protein
MAKDSNGTAQAALCSKCGERPAAKTHKWCNECKAEAQQQYDADRIGMLEARAYIRGAQAMKAILLTALLSAHPNGRMLVHEVIGFINDAQPPQST